MRRFGLVVAIPFSLALATPAGEAQPNPPVRTIGILAGTPEASRVFERGLRDLGWIEGQNDTLTPSWCSPTPCSTSTGGGSWRRRRSTAAIE